MRARWSLPYAILFGLLWAQSVTSEAFAVQPRQDVGASQSPSATQSVTLTAAGSSGSRQSSNNEESAAASPTDESSVPSEATASKSDISSLSRSEPSTGTATSSNAASSSPDLTSSNAQSASPAPSTTMSAHDLPPSAYKGNLYTDPNSLPLQPKITPAFSIAGVLMMIAGTVYALIGIKNKLIHIFLSTAFLASLAVTVLIVYVMNPPISNAVQGAYFVAASVTGIIFGAGSIVFTEVTEGLGCLLGGFCLSMWFLVLKPGGLLTSTTQKAIFIAVFSLGIFALSFSRYTRPYGLIGSTSFAGAMVVVLGIDCFSRAGLKEFWAYLWSLNANLFPLGTTTYPITRGIRVEIAGTILFFLLGIVSQSKLWKVIKDRRERKAAERHDREVQREREEEDLGRRLEEGNHRERARWEAVYGDKDKANDDMADSGVGTEAPDSRKVSASIIDTKNNRYSTGEAIEMSHLDGYKHASHTEAAAKRGSRARDSATPTVMLVHDDEDIHEVQDTGQEIGTKSHQRFSRSSMRTSTPDGFLDVPTHGSSPTRSQSNSPKPTQMAKRRSVPPAPEVIPLPFTVPVAEESDDDDDPSSAVTYAESDRYHATPAKRLSGRSILKRLSGRSLLEPSQSKEALVIPHVEDDQASSVAATVDEDGEEILSAQPEENIENRQEGQLEAGKLNQSNNTNLPELPSFSAFNDLNPFTDTATPKSNNIGDIPKCSNDDVNAQRPTINNLNSTSSSELPPLHSSGEVSKNSTQRTSLTSATDPKKDDRIEQMEDAGTTRQSNTTSETQQVDPAEQRPKTAKSNKSIVPSEASARHSSKASFSEQLPTKLSKVVMSYRTNEWAKHLSNAEKPELEELRITEQSREDQEAEAAVPVHIEELQQTATDAQPPPASRISSHLSSSDYQQPSALNRSSSRLSLQDQQPRVSFSHTPYGIIPSIPPSQSLMAAGGPQQSLALNTRGLRSSSTPLTSVPLVESPLEEGLESSYPSRFTPSPIPSNTLLAKRDNIVRNRYSSLPFSPSPAASSQQLAPNDSASVRNCQLNSLDDDDDNMSLSRRRSLLQEQRQLQQSSLHLSPQDQSFDSHQPQRYSTPSNLDRREAMLASWRHSVRQDLASNQQPNFSVDARRQDLMMEKYQSGLHQQQQTMAVNYRDSVFDQAMRRGDMLDLHKEAIRKMQASANKHV